MVECEISLKTQDGPDHAGQVDKFRVFWIRGWVAQGDGMTQLVFPKVTLALKWVVASEWAFPSLPGNSREVSKRTLSLITVSAKLCEIQAFVKTINPTAYVILGALNSEDLYSTFLEWVSLYY